MPRRSKKSKPASEAKATVENENVRSLTDHAKECGEEKPEKKSLLLSLDKKLKLQVKKQKKKEKKREFEEGNKKIPEEVSMVPEVEWETTTELESVQEERGNVVEEVVLVTRPQVVNDVSLNSPEMSEEEEKCLREFLRTLDIVEGGSSKEGETRIGTQVVKKKLNIETIPEDLFEEFIENQEMTQAKETIKTFPKTSPLHSPKPKRRQANMAEVVVHSPPKVFYNIHGMSYTTPSAEKSVNDEEDGIVIINTYRSCEQEMYPRRLDVIMEESSDFSDASGQSEKKMRSAGEAGKKGLKIFSVERESKDGAALDVANGDDSYTVQPVIVEKLKMSDDVVKIELVESESEGDFDINQSEISYSVEEMETVKLADENSDIVTVGGNGGAKWEKDDRRETGSWSVHTASSDSGKIGEEGSESWRSSLNPDGSCDGAEADVESELDSQKAFIFGDADRFSLTMSDILDGNGVEIFITDIKKVDGTKSGSRDSWKSSKSLPLSEIEGENVLPKTHETHSESDPNCFDVGLDVKTAEPVQTGVNVKEMAEAIKNDMDKILFSKIKIIKCAEEPRINESFWVSVVKDTRDQLESKNNSSESDAKPSYKSDSSSYENVPKHKEIVRIPKTPPKQAQNPEALSNLAEKKILTMPYGKLVLKKIGLSSCCSKDSESGKEEEAYVKNNMEKNSVCGSVGSSVKLEDEENQKSGKSYIEFDYSNPKMGETEKWYGMRTATPAILVGLSPSQKKVYEEKQKRWLPEEAEAASLLDLHRKFIERRSYYESNPWSRERNIVYDSTAKGQNVFITGISELNRRAKHVEKKEDRTKEKKIVKESVALADKSDQLPGKTLLRLVGNEKPRTEESELKPKCYSVKDDKKKSNDSRTGGKKGEETNIQTEKDSEFVGKSRLLAILQNAISDDFVPKLNTDSSIKSSCENHEVSLVQNQEIMDRRRREKESKIISKHENGAKVENSLRRDQKTFQDFWNKEKNYCNTENGRSRAIFRPKTICCENESELYINELKFMKQVRAAGNAPTAEKEKLIITENLPAVSDTIKSFEEPKVKKWPTNGDDKKNKKTQIQIDNEKYHISQRGDIALIQSDSSERKKMQREKRKSMPASILSEKEIFKQKMYDEYMSKLAERIERRQQKVIKVSQSNEIECPEESKFLDLESEFFSKVKERKEKLGIAGNDGGQKELYESLKDFRSYWEGEISSMESERVVFRDREDLGGTESTNSKRSSIQLLDTSSDLESLPKHLKEFLQVEGEEFPDFFEGVWSPAQTVSDDKTEEREENEERKKLENAPIPPVWTPRSAQASPVLEKKEFRPVNFESPTLPRKRYIQDDKKESSVPPPWQQPGGDKPPQLAKSPSSPALSLPKAPNPTVTLLQKAREGYLPRGAHYLNSDMNESPASDGTTIERLEIVSSLKSEPDRTRKTETGPKKIIGIGPTTKEGIPLVLRSEVTAENKEKWYKRMYDSLHKYGNDDDYVTVKYRTSPRRKGLYNYQYGSSSGYQSEPESISYDIANNKYVTLDRRRKEKTPEKECLSVTIPRSRTSPPRRDFRDYKNQPGRIEDYEPGHSSISELEANKWWDEVLEIFDKWLDRSAENREPACSNLLIDGIQLRQEEEKSRPVVIRKPQSPKSFINYASGYISDPQYVYKRTEEELQSPPSSEEQKEAYKIIQKGGEIPLRGLRKPAPERPKDSINTEIEYFPLSPTLTRIRVHKQNITPLSEYPFTLYPLSCNSATLNYPPLPFGVCSSFSQVQVFPPVVPQLAIGGVGSESSPGKEQKFSVQLQNISGPEDYVQIVPKPRSQPRKSPIYANIPVRGRSCSPVLESSENESDKKSVLETGSSVSGQKLGESAVSVEKSPEEKSPKREGFATFSDLKRIAPSVNSSAISKISLSRIPTKQRKTDNPAEKSKAPTKRKDIFISRLAPKSSVKVKKTVAESKENNTEKRKIPAEKVLKKDKKKAETKAKETGVKGSKAKVPLSESAQREKPLAKSNKRLKTLSESLKRRKLETKNKQDASEDKSSPSDTKEDLIEYLTKFVEYSNTSYVDLKSPEEVRTVAFLESENEEDTMSPVYETIEQKPKVDADMTEVFRSRSFSPDVKRKIFKLPDMNKPVPPKRKESKMSPTLKLWSKMMVSYPRHRSRLESYDSNVKFLGDRIKRKLADEKDTKAEFGDNIETVRTVRKDKNGDMSIKTNRYVKLARPSSSGILSTRATYPDIEHRRSLSGTKTKFGSADSIQPRKYSDASTVSKSAGSELRKPAKKLDTVLRSSTTYSVKNPSREDDDKRKSVKVTVAISSKGKEIPKKGVGAAPTVRKAVSKSSSSPCPSVSSFRSNASGKSDKGSISSQERMRSPTTRIISPNSSTNISRSTSPGSASSRLKVQKQITKKPVGPPVMSTYEIKAKPEAKAKCKDIGKTITKSSTKRLITETTPPLQKETKASERLKKIGNGKIKTIVHKRSPEIATQTEANEVLRGRDIVRTDSFFQNLFLRGPVDKRPVFGLERTTSVLERARRYQSQLNWPETYKSEPSLSLVTYYLNQKRPVSFSKFRNWDQEGVPPRWPSPLGSLHSESFQMKLRRFDSMSQFGDGLQRDVSPEAKERSSSEPPLHRSHTTSPGQKPEGKSSRVSLSEASSMRSSPNSSRSPSCRRIHSYKSSLRTLDCGRDLKKNISRARSAGEIEEMKLKSNLQYGDLGKSSSSLNLSNLSDHTEYQAYVLELMHSSRKCERFRELHKFYTNLERMEKLEKTASTGDLRPRLRNEEIIDFDRWKKIRTKERAEAELKALVDNLVKVQKEKDLLFRASDVEAVRWRGDSGLRIKERSVEDLREQFNKYSEESLDQESWKKEVELRKDHYKPLWRGSSIVDVASNLNNALVSHRGRPITVQELEKIEKSKAKIGKEYGYSLKAWSSLSNEQVNALKDQLSEIYTQDPKRRYLEGSLEDLPDKYEIFVPKDSDVQSPGESSLQVRCSSALSKSQTYTPTVKRKEELRKEWKKADSISAFPTGEEDVNLLQLPWKEETKIGRSHSESRSEKLDRYPLVPRSKSATSSKPLSENEKKRLSMTLSKEVIQKMSKAGGKGPVFPRETLGALAAAGGKLREQESTEAAEQFIEEWTNESEMEPVIRKPPKEQESGSGSSEASIKTVIRKDSMDVLKKVQYFEELQQSADEYFGSEVDPVESHKKKISETKSSKDRKSSRSSKGKKKNVLIASSSMENLNDFFGQQKQYATSPVQSKPAGKPASHTTSETSKALVQVQPRGEDFYDMRHVFEDRKWAPVRYYSTSPLGLRSGSSNDSLFSGRSRSVSPDPTKYYRAYLRMVKCGAVRKLCNKFESWEDLLSMSSDRDFWLPPPPRRFASDPELTRDLLKRFGTDPTKVTIRGQEVGDVRWLRTKFEKDLHPTRGRSRFRRVRSPLVRSPLTLADRFMPRINVISKTAELQMQAERKQKDSAPTKAHLLAASPENYRSLIDYTKDHGGYYYTGEVEKLRRKFERLQEAERLSILGQMYTSAPNMHELRDIAPYLECSWIAHRYPGVSKTASSPEILSRRQEPPKKPELKPRPHSSSPIRPKQPSSILKPSCTYPDRFANQKFDPSIHRPKYRYQPEREVDRRYKRGDPDWWRHWNKPTVKFKESVSFKSEPEIRDLSPESPRKYVESEVTIHYKSPVRSEAKAMLSEDELARRQAESMKRIYKEERRRKYLQELQDMNSRRHTDNFIPSQKSPISLNRYDDFPVDPSAYYRREYSTDPVLVARGLYDFVGRRPRELGFRRGDIIFIIRKLDKNWCEGELNGVVGLFPLSYVEVIPYSEINLKYGRARAKYDFIPQTSLELLAHKGDMITLLRKIDENWFEGRIGDRTGIIPASYCHILAMPQASRMPGRVEKSVSKPVASPAAHSLIHNGSGLSSKHYYAPYLSPSSPGRSTTSSASVNYHPSADMLIDEALMQLDEEFDLKRSKPASQPLNVRINPRPEPELYQVLFNHVPNNDDELELVQGETVTVVEKCGDGWYIGSKSDGKLGIFPGTHVRRIAPEFV